MKEIKGVIFDMDGVITDSETYARKAMHLAFEKNNIEWDEDYYNSLLGVNHVTGDQITLKKFNGDKDLAKKVMDRFINELHNFFVTKQVKFKPGAIELINYLNQNNFPIALATSGDENKIKLSFESNDVAIPFKHIVNGQMVSKSKPDPEVFLKAAALLNLDIKDCMVIEDSNNGLQAAITAGAIATLVPDYILPDKCWIEKATYVKKDLFEVQEILKQYVNPLESGS